jgi:hypothetical protein
MKYFQHYESEQTFVKYLTLLQTSKTNRPQRKAKSTSVMCKMRIYMTEKVNKIKQVLVLQLNFSLQEQ